MNKLIGITGGMASGKTTLAKKLIESNKDYVYIDVDVFRRNLYNNEKYINKLKEVIPELKQYEKIDSKILNKYIYDNDDYMKKYKKVLYRYLEEYIDSYSNKVILVDWALILNDNLEGMFTKIIYVNTSVEERLKRLSDSDLTRDEIRKRFKLQEIEKGKLDMSNILVVDGGKEFNVREINNFIKGMECKFTLPNDGGKAIWEITHQCNYGCSYCIFSCNNKKTFNELSTEECFHVIDELVAHDFKHLKITGGEPFIRKDIIEILRYASQRMITDISTNASLITEEHVKLLNELKLKMIHVSLDGNREEHESVRGVNTYDRTIRGLKALESSKNKVRIGAVIHANNENNLENLVNSAKELQADEIIFSIMEPVEGQDKSLVKTRSNEELGMGIKELQDKYQGEIIVNYNFVEQPNYISKCPAGDKFLYVNNLGFVSPCPWVFEKNKKCISGVSLRDNSLDEVLKDSNLQCFLKAKSEGKCYGKI